MSGFLVKLLNTRESYILYIFWGKKTSNENGNQGVDYIPKRNALLRIKETLSLNALRVTDPVILFDIR